MGGRLFGTNDISDRSIRSALTVGSQLEDLTKLLHEQFGVTVVCVCHADPVLANKDFFSGILTVYFNCKYFS